MSLAPEASISTGLAVGAVTYSIFNAHLPSIADVRTVEVGNSDLHAAINSAAWQAAGVVAAVSLIAKDATIFIIGGAMTCAMAWAFLHAENVSPITKKASGTFSVDDVLAGQMKDAAPQIGSAPVAMTYDTVI